MLWVHIHASEERGRAVGASGVYIHTRRAAEPKKKLIATRSHRRASISCLRNRTSCLHIRWGAGPEYNRADVFCLSVRVNVRMLRQP